MGTGVFVILARLLEPKSFGLLAMAAVVINFMDVFLRQGLGQAIVQRKDLEPGHLDTAFWINVGSAGLLAFLAFAGAGLCAALFREPDLAPVVRWLSVGLLIGGLNATPQAILARDMAFKSLAIRSLLAVGGGGIVGITMAVCGYGVWSLVGQHLTAAGIGTVVLWRASGFRPGLNVSRKHARELFSFGAFVMGIDVLAFVAMRVDVLMLAYFLTAVEVGVYEVAFRLLRTMTKVLTQTISAVALSTFSRIQHDRAQLRSAYLTATQMTAVVAFPAFVGVAVLAPDLVHVLFGPKWEASITPMRVLSFVGMLYAVFYCNEPVVLACGKPAWRFLLALIQAVVQVIAVAIAVRWGVIGVAAAFVIRVYLLAPLSVVVLRRLINLHWGELAARLSLPLGAALVMAGCVWLVRSLSVGIAPLPASLGLCIIAGVAVYAVTLRVLAPSLIVYVGHLLREGLSRQRVGKG